MLRLYRAEVFVSIICVFGCALTSILYPWLLKHLLDMIVKKADIPALLTAALFIAVLYFVRGIFDYGKVYWLELLARKIAARFREKLFYRIQRFSLSYYEKRSTGEIMSSITSDIGVIENGITNELRESSVSLLNVIGAFIFLIYIYWPFAFVSVFVSVLMIGSLRLLKLKVRKLTSEVQDKKARLSAILEENISGIQLIKAYSSEDYETKRFNTVNDEVLKISLSEVKLDTLAAVLMGFLAGLCLVFVLVSGGIEVIKARLTLGTLVALILYIQIVNGHAHKVIKGYIAVQKMSVAGKRVFDVLSEEAELGSVEKLASLPLIKGEIEFKSVVFSYEKNALALKSISFNARAGESVALVGPNGAGKSTIIKLLFRFYEPNGGTIYIDGNDIRQFSHNSLRRQMAIVLQENILFSGSISDNIAFGESNPSYDRIVKAAKLANADGFIVKLPDGYNTYVGERGIKLSGGQRQLIGIARVMYRNPRIIVLDEAFSYLDVNSEALIQEGLQNAIKEKTVFIIAHRLSTIINSSKIIVINNGEIVGVGSHDELIQENAAYKKLYQSQLQSLYTASA
jgi:subfamily B ATP-binding cassette protein MsbA